MLPKDESEPFLKDSGPVMRSSSSLERYDAYGCLGLQRRWSKNPTAIPSQCMIVAVFIATSLFWGSIILFIMHASPPIYKPAGRLDSLKPYYNVTSGAELLTCGHSTPEAKEKGCQYDILSNHWVPDICMDQEAVEEYQADGSWFGFADEHRTELLTIDAMSEMDFYYTSERDHIVHCAMLWRKQYKAFFEGRQKLDTLIASKSHTLHCSQFLIDMTENGPDYWNMPIKTWVGYAGCWVRG